MWRKISKKEQEKYLSKWISNITKNKKNTKLSVKRHIVYHAKQIFIKDPKLWSASMRNLIEIYENLYNTKPSVKTRLERLENKYKKNPKRYTPPPSK